MADEKEVVPDVEEGGEAVQTQDGAEGASAKETAPTEEGAEGEDGEGGDGTPPEEEDIPKYTPKQMKGMRISLERDIHRAKARADAADAKAEAVLEVLKALGIEKLQAGQPQAQTQEQPTTVTRPTRPSESDFETREQFNSAMDKYEDDLYLYRESLNSKKRAEQSAAEAAKQNESTISSAIRKQVDEGKKSFEDFEEVVLRNEDLAISDSMAVAISKRDNGHEVQYFLGKNVEESRRLYAIKDPIELAAEIGAISMRLKVEKSTPPAQPAKKRTGAPAPAKSIPGGQSPSKTDTVLEGKTSAERIAILERTSRERRANGTWAGTRAGGH